MEEYQSLAVGTFIYKKKHFFISILLTKSMRVVCNTKSHTFCSFLGFNYKMKLLFRTKSVLALLDCAVLLELLKNRTVRSLQYSSVCNVSLSTETLQLLTA